jgi:DNA polymerase III delta prime subunit
LLQVIGKEGLTATKEGLEAIIFTADGDMRQALNNLQVRADLAFVVHTLHAIIWQHVFGSHASKCWLPGLQQSAVSIACMWSCLLL